MKNPIIEARLNRMIKIKKELLTMKKSERGNQVKEIEDVINRLKKWLADPATEVRTPRNEHAIHDNHANQQQDNKKINPFATVNQAMKEFAKALGTLDPDQRKSEQEIRDIVEKVGKRHADDIQAIKQDNERRDRVVKEMAGKRPKSMSKTEIMDPTDTNGPIGSGKWRQPVVENVHTVFRRMNGMD